MQAAHDVVEADETLRRTSRARSQRTAEHQLGAQAGYRVRNEVLAERCRIKRLQQALRRTYLHYVFAARDQDTRVSIAQSDSRIHENAQSRRIGLKSCAEGIIQE